MRSHPNLGRITFYSTFFTVLQSLGVEDENIHVRKLAFEVANLLALGQKHLDLLDRLRFKCCYSIQMHFGMLVLSTRFVSSDRMGTVPLHNVGRISLKPKSLAQHLEPTNTSIL